MAITFACSCGKQMQAKEEFAGRRMKCPACQRIVAIPGPTAAPSPVPVVTAAAPVPAAAPRLVRFACGCGKLLQADSSKVGRPLRCPACGALVTVPAEQPAALPVAVETEKPFLARAVRETPNPWLDPALAQQVTPWQGDDARRFGASDWEGRDRRSEGRLLVLLLVLLAASAALAAWYYGGDLRQYVRARQPAANVVDNWNRFSDLDLLPRSAKALVSARLSELWASKTGQDLRARLKPLGDVEGPARQLTGLSPAAVARVTLLVPPASAGQSMNGPKALLFIATLKPFDQARVRQALAGPGPTKSMGGARPAYKLLRDPTTLVAFLNDRVLVLGNAAHLEWLLDQQPNPKDRGPLSDVMDAASQHDLVAGMVQLEQGPPKGVPAFGQPMPKVEPLSRQLAGLVPVQYRSLLPLVDFRTSLLTLDAAKDLHLEAHLTYGEAKQALVARLALENHINFGRKMLAAARRDLAARRSQALLPALTLTVGAASASQAVVLESLPSSWMLMGTAPQRAPEAGAHRKDAEEILGMAEQALDKLKVAGQGKDLHVSFELDAPLLLRAVGLLMPAVQPIREAPLRQQSLNNLKQLALAMHMYHDAFGHLPPAVVGKGLSWRVALLPFLEQTDQYRQFHLDEPWNSPHNIKLLDKMPAVFAPLDRSKAPPNTTFWQVFNGPGAAFEGKRELRFAEFTDGLSNTLLIAEAGRAVPWTKPEDLAYNPKGPLPKLGGEIPGVFLAALGDGSVRAIPLNLGEPALRALITRAGGEALELPPIGPPRVLRPGEGK